MILQRAGCAEVQHKLAVNAALFSSAGITQPVLSHGPRTGRQLPAIGPDRSPGKSLPGAQQKAPRCAPRAKVEAPVKIKLGACVIWPSGTPG